MNILAVEIILYVEEQSLSRDFYAKILQKQPLLDLPGMTSFILNDTLNLGLMPNTGIAKILSKHLPHPQTGNGIPRCELYLYVEDIESAYQNALKQGAKLVSALSDRDWGDTVCYFSDLDGHILAFAARSVK